MSPRIQTSEPAYRAPVNQWQRERSRGEIIPLGALPPKRHLPVWLEGLLLWLGIFGMAYVLLAVFS